MNRLALLDRDGTIVKHVPYLSSPEQLELIVGAAEAIRLFRKQGFKVAIVTNQSAIGRGMIDQARLELIHQRLLRMLEAEEAFVDAVYYCPHTPSDDCECRKPQPGLAFRAAKELGAELATSIVVGDNLCDIELGRRVGSVTCLVRTGHGAELEEHGTVTPDFVVDDLLAAAKVMATS